MQDLSLYSSEKVFYSYRLAGLGSRFIGVLLDTLIIFALYLVLGIFGALMVSIFENLPETAKIILIVIVLLLFFLIGIGYFIFFETIWNGQTPGKRAAGLRVVRKTGETVTFSNVLVRNLMRFVDYLPAFYTVGMAAIFFSGACQRVGDMVADTVVVRESDKSQPALFDAGSLDPALADRIRPLINLIDEQDFYLIRDFFARLAGLKPEQAIPISEKIAAGLAAKLGLAPGESQNPVLLMRTVGALFKEK